MSRKDFVKIAAVLRWVSEHPEADPGTVALAIQAMADTLATTNERFDRERFVKACAA